MSLRPSKKASPDDTPPEVPKTAPISCRPRVPLSVANKKPEPTFSASAEDAVFDSHRDEYEASSHAPPRQPSTGIRDTKAVLATDSLAVVARNGNY